MRADEAFRLLLFLGAVGTIDVLAVVIIVRRLLARRRPAAGAPSPSGVRLLERAILTLAGIGLLCMAYGRFVEPFRLEVVRVRVATSRLAPGSQPFRIALISDLHSDPRPRLENRLPEAIAGERPDLVLFAGDSINSPGGLPVFRECLTRIARIAPTFVVKGNWDVWTAPHLERFAGTGARELDGEAVRLDVRGAAIWIAGVAVENESALDRTLAGMPPDGYRILLHHYPDLIHEAADRKVDLYGAGHTHGGQVALPFYGAILTLSRFGKRYEAGLYRERDTWMYVNRGIGMEGGPAPRVRFCARPELTIIDVVPSE
ncbi:MAG: metallophosphoesterase [Candidatus Polarisedimenticolia bacterium]